MNDAASLLQHTGLKVTKNRLEVLHLLMQAHKPVSIEEIQNMLGGKSPDRVTLYRMMNQFHNAGIASRVDFREGFERFEFQEHHHHHMVCTDCGLVEEFEWCNADHISRHILKTSKNFSFIKDHSLELFGLCKECSKV